MDKYKFEIKRKSRNEIEVNLSKDKDNSFKWSNVAPWSAIFISVITLIFTLNQNSKTIEHDHLSVKPYLIVQRFGITKSNMGIEIENNGIGPAILKEYHITYNGRDVASFNMLRSEIIKEIPELKGDLTFSEINVGYYYRAGDKKMILSTGDTINSDIRLKLADMLTNKMEVELVYCSVYNECRKTRMIKPINDCSKKTNSFCSAY